MPGISLIYDKKGELIQDESLISNALGSLIHTDKYEREILVKEKSFLLAYTRYKEYPVTTFQNGDFCIILEGRIYGSDGHAVEKELNSLANLIFQSGTREQISEWLLNTDGDFIVVVLHKKNNVIAILNDALGRLPLYYHKSSEQLIVTRELRFIARLQGNPAIDMMSIAQSLLFSHPLGKRTFLKNCNRLEPATLMVVNTNEFDVKIENLNSLNFELRSHSDRTIQQNADELVSLFTEACKNRTGKTKQNVVSLSGGLDSRSVAGALHRNNIPFYGTTMLDFDKSTFATDIPIAEQLAEVFNIDWQLFQLPPPKGRDLLKLLKIKNGSNYLGMGFIIPYFDKILETHGPGITFFTGDGGDQILQRDWRPEKKLKNIDELIEYIILMSDVLPLNTIAELTGIKERDIIDELKSVLLAYPETDYRQKYVHFVTCEIGFNWYWEGEDRNRFFFWSVTPFYSIHFFDYAMNCPDGQKSQYALYRSFLSKLSPEAAGVGYAGSQTLLRLPITSRRFIFFRSMVAILSRYPVLKKRLINILKPRITESYEHSSNIINCLRDQMDSSEIIRGYLSRSAMNDIIENCNQYSKRQIINTLTVSSAIEELVSGKSTLEKYYDAEFR